jgi:hypothetical protein
MRKEDIVNFTLTCCYVRTFTHEIAWWPLFWRIQLSFADKMSAVESLRRWSELKSVNALTWSLPWKDLPWLLGTVGLFPLAVESRLNLLHIQSLQYTIRTLILGHFAKRVCMMGHNIFYDSSLLTYFMKSLQCAWLQVWKDFALFVFGLKDISDCNPWKLIPDISSHLVCYTRILGRPGAPWSTEIPDYLRGTVVWDVQGHLDELKISRGHRYWLLSNAWIEWPSICLCDL